MKLSILKPLLFIFLTIFIPIISQARVSIYPAYNLQSCPKIADLTVLGPVQYKLETPYSTFHLSGEDSTKTLIETLTPWSNFFEQSGDLIFKFRDINLCVGLYDDRKAPNAFAWKTQYVMMGISMAAQLEDIPRVQGKTSIQFVMAHEFAHFIQNQYDLKFNYILPMLSTKIQESHADCLAGMLLTYFEKYSITEMLGASETVLTLADPHIVGDHGTKDQRKEALWNGISEGLKLKLKNQKLVTAWDMANTCGQKYKFTNAR
ncbi:MAG TPA: hypothetical protein PLJ21_04940 [Pseudobdellovibrionaceae bacterium]|nr:hypothetical protein [Pseudobdellovibrionaceae bacterium]